MSKQSDKACYPDNFPFDFPTNSVHDVTACIDDTNPGNSGGDDCLSKWKTQKDQAKSDLDLANAEVESAKKRVENAAHWEQKLKVYCDNIEKTDELANKVTRELKTLKDQICVFCFNADCMVQALEILYCETREIYDPCVNEMVKLIDKINKCLSCITDSGFDRSVGITKAIDEYAAKLKELADLQKDALTKIIKALEIANIIFYALCETPTKKEQDFKCDSLEKELEELCYNFGDDIKCDAPNGNACEPLTCEAMCKDLTPVPVFPLCKDEYYTETKAQYVAIKTESTAAKDDLDQKKETQKKAFLTYNGIQNAIEAANNAKAG